MKKLSIILALLLVSNASAQVSISGSASVSGNTLICAPTSALATPVDSPGTGTYSSAQTVTLSLPSGSTGCYTLSGTSPTAPTAGTCGAGSTTYTGSFSISSTTTLKALATEAGYANSALLTSVYTISTNGAPTYSPAAGTYSSAQNVTLATTLSGGSIFDTTDGSAPSIASALYSAAIPVSTTTTIHAMAANLGTAAQGINNASTNWKICTPNGGGSPASQACLGVGSNQPSAWNYTFGSTMQESVSTTTSNGETQILFIYTGAGCDNCTNIAMDKWVKPTADKTIIANNEMDMFHFDHSRNIEHMFGLQCNQLTGDPGYGQWQIDNTGSWVNTGITDGCPLSTTAYTHVVYQGHWIPGDTGCGGLGCNYYDSLTINGVVHTLGNSLSAASIPSNYTSGCGSQDQIDLTGTGASSTSPQTGGRDIQSSNVTCGYSVTPSSSATYTISGAAFNATPSSVSEGSIPTATTAYYQPVTVTNTGTANLTFSSIAFTGTNASDFSQTAGFAPAVNPVGGNTYPQCSTSSPVAPGGKCIVPIDFVPGASGARYGSLTFTDNAPGSPHTVTLSGTGTAASGTPLPACGSMLAANTTYYATGNITCNDSGFGLNGAGITVNLNGYTLTCGQSPSTAQAARWCFYNANSSDPAFTGTCAISGSSQPCANGITPTTTNGGNEVIENGTIVVAGGATSSATMQYGSAAVLTGYGAANGAWDLHDLHITIPLFCTSCWAYSGWSNGTYNGVGDHFYKNTIADNSGFVQSRCNYDGAAVRFADTNTTAPGAIAYENTIDHSPQDGFVASTQYSTIFGNTVKIGNPNGTSAGTSSTCSGVGSGPNGTQSANDFDVEVANSNISVVNNTYTNYEGRGNDMSSPNGALANITTAGNTITTTDLPNYVEYQGGAYPGCQLGGSYGERLNTFGTTSTMNSSGDTTTVTVTKCPGTGYSISSSNNAANSTQNGNYTCKFGAGRVAGANCYGITNGESDYVTGTPAMFYSSNETYTGDTADAAIGYAPTGMSGPWTITDSTFVEPATAAPGSCGDPGTPVEPSWTVFSGCTANLGSASTMGPVYVRNPTWVGGAGESNLDDFPTATADMTAGSTGSIYIQWGYTVTVNKASGGVASGATVSIIDTKSSTECTATTNSSGVATCWLNETEHSFTAPNPEVITTFNPMAETVTDSGCTTLNDSFSISSTTSRTVTLAGC